MVFKFVIVTIALLGFANAAVLVKTAAPLAVAPAPVLAKTVELEEYDPHPQYKYGYDVQDTISGDSKGHVEERDGDVVHGEYSLIDADGLRRTVSYTADPINGFNAVVRREPVVAAVAAAPVARAAAPIVAAPAAAVVRSAPLVAAPVVRSAPFVAPAPAVVRTASYVAAAPAPLLRSAPFAAAPLTYSAPFVQYRNL